MEHYNLVYEDPTKEQLLGNIEWYESRIADIEAKNIMWKQVEKQFPKLYWEGQLQIDKNNVEIRIIECEMEEAKKQLEKLYHIKVW